MDYKPFSKIERFENVKISISQKLHGSNASIYIYKTEDGTLDLKCGKRTDWITPEQDNFGFAKFVYDNKEAFLKLGEGYHFGEYCGPGINSGEGLKERTLVLFDYWRYQDIMLPPNTMIVPVLYEGPNDGMKIVMIIKDLKENGSKLVKGFMNVEGVVISMGGHRYKILFKPEETQWKKPRPTGEPKEQVDVSHLLQPVRLEKLLSKDEKYRKDYPQSISLICKDYIQDLEQEGQITGNKDEVKKLKNALGKQMFNFIKEFI